MTRKVAVNEAILARGISGSARVTQYTIDALHHMPDVDVSGVRPSRSRGSSKVANAIADARWDLMGASRAAGRVDLLLSPCNIGKAWGSQRHVLMVYDVMVWEAREHFDPAFAAYARALIPLSMRQADLVLTISEHSRAALSAMVPGVPVRVVHPPPPERKVDRVTFPVTSPTVVVLGETAPHKNQVAAIEAVVEVRRTSGVDLRLRVIGPPGRAEDTVLDRMRAVDPSGSWTRRDISLSDADLNAALGSAWVLLQPSLHEGYGLPLVEAAQRGLPVVHSGREGMQDILPECSVGSTSSEPHAQRLALLLDEKHWSEVASYCLARAALFTRDQFDRGIAESVEQVLGRHPSVGSGGRSHQHRDHDPRCAEPE